MGSGSSRVVDSDPSSGASSASITLSSASITLSSTPPSSEGRSSAPAAPAARGRAGAPLSGGHSRGSSSASAHDCSGGLHRAAASPGAGGGERGGSWIMDSRRAQVMSSLCIAHAATAAEQLLYEVSLPREVRADGLADTTTPAGRWDDCRHIIGWTTTVGESR